MRDEGRPADYAERASGIGMLDFDILRQHRRESCPFADAITKRAPKHSAEIGTSGSDDDIPLPILPSLCMGNSHLNLPQITVPIGFDRVRQKGTRAEQYNQQHYYFDH
jgi:hypothetical protein